MPSSQKVDDDKTLRAVVWANTDVVLEELLVQTERQLLTSLYKSGHMSKPEVCTHCHVGKVGHLLFQREKWQFRCSSKHCHKYILPVSTSKVFSSRTGLKEQVGALFCLVWGIPIGLIPTMVRGATKNVVDTISKKWRAALTKYVNEKQKDIVIEGNRSMRAEFEVDEGCFGLEERGSSDPGEEVTIHEVVAVKARGNRESLHVSRRDPFECVSSRAANGRAVPRPYTKNEWQQLRDLPQSSGDPLIGQHVLQHTGGATSYQALRDGQARDSVSHASKKGGPYFTKTTMHANPDGSSFQAQAGTQMLDGWFARAKDNCRDVNRRYGSAVDDKIKESQG